MTTVRPRYDTIGDGYARTRREDPRFAAAIHAALGNARSIVNVGAGTGSYEPRDRHVVAIEPSDVMAAQRPPELAPSIRAGAGALPLRDGSVDAAMAIVTLHHWDASGESPGGDSLGDSLARISYQERGVRELRRVARGPVVILTYDPRVSGAMWLMADYLPEVAALDHAIFPHPERLADWLGGGVAIEPVPIPRDARLDARLLLGSPRARARSRRARRHLGLRAHGAGDRRPLRGGRHRRPGLRRLGRPPR